MAGITSGFVTGARAKIQIGGKTMAFASDVGYTIDIGTVAIETMGKYEVHTNEPVSYTVRGNFSIVRYTSQDAKTSGIKDESATANNNGTAPAGNNTNAQGQLSEGTAPGNMLDPSLILASSTFDLVLMEKYPTSSSDVALVTIQDCRITSRSASLNKRSILVDNYNFVAVIAGDNDTGAFPGPSGMDQSIG